MCILRRGKTFLYKIHPVAFDCSSPFSSCIKTKHHPTGGVFFYAKDYLSGAELGEKLPKSNVPVLFDKLELAL